MAENTTVTMRDHHAHRIGMAVLEILEVMPDAPNPASGVYAVDVVNLPPGKGYAARVKVGPYTLKTPWHSQEKAERIAEGIRTMLTPAPAVQLCTFCQSRVDPDGATSCQLHDGRWTCSRRCWERAARMWDGIGPEGEEEEPADPPKRKVMPKPVGFVPLETLAPLSGPLTISTPWRLVADELCTAPLYSESTVRSLVEEAASTQQELWNLRAQVGRWRTNHERAQRDHAEAAQLAEVAKREVMVVRQTLAPMVQGSGAHHTTQDLAWLVVERLERAEKRVRELEEKLTVANRSVTARDENRRNLIELLGLDEKLHPNVYTAVRVLKEERDRLWGRVRDLQGERERWKETADRRLHKIDGLRKRVRELEASADRLRQTIGDQERWITARPQVTDEPEPVEGKGVVTETEERPPMEEVWQAHVQKGAIRALHSEPLAVWLSDDEWADGPPPSGGPYQRATLIVHPGVVAPKETDGA